MFQSMNFHPTNEELVKNASSLPVVDCLDGEKFQPMDQYSNETIVHNQAQPTFTDPAEVYLTNARRTTAFVSIYNKSEAAKSKEKTKMCKSIMAGFPCKFGDKCTFAHSADELKVQKCAFGSVCKIRYSKTNPCQYDHTDEIIPEPASRATLVEEMKLYWEREEQEAQKIIFNFKQNHPKLEPFLIYLDEMVFDQKIQSDTESFEELDDETKAIAAMCAAPVRRIQITNTADLFEGGMPFHVSSLDQLP